MKKSKTKNTNRANAVSNSLKNAFDTPEDQGTETNEETSDYWKKIKDFLDLDRESKLLGKKKKDK